MKEKEIKIIGVSEKAHKALKEKKKALKEEGTSATIVFLASEAIVRYLKENKTFWSKVDSYSYISQTPEDFDGYLSDEEFIFELLSFLDEFRPSLAEIRKLRVFGRYKKLDKGELFNILIEYANFGLQELKQDVA